MSADTMNGPADPPAAVCEVCDRDSDATTFATADRCDDCAGRTACDECGASVPVGTVVDGRCIACAGGDHGDA